MNLLELPNYEKVTILAKNNFNIEENSEKN